MISPSIVLGRINYLTGPKPVGCDDDQQLASARRAKVEPLGPAPRTNLANLELPRTITIIMINHGARVIGTARDYVIMMISVARCPGRHLAGARTWPDRCALINVRGRSMELLSRALDNRPVKVRSSRSLMFVALFVRVKRPWCCITSGQLLRVTIVA